MPTPILPTVEITPGSTGAWTDVDVSAYVPANAVGVAVRIYGTNGSGRAIGLRKNGSTDNRTTNLAPNRQWMGLAGLDANQVLEAYVGGTDVDLYLVGYWTDDEAVFLTNAVDVSLGSTGSWLDVDISGSTGADTALAALIEVDTSSANQGFGVRQNGSTDTLLQGGTTSIYHGWVCVGVDGAEIFEGNIESTGVDFFLIGYLTAAVTWNTNAIDRQTGTTGSYEAVAAPNATAVMAEYTFYPDSATAQVDIREKGGSVTLQQNVVVGQQAYLMTGLDTVDHQAEQFTASAGIDCWELCWFAESPTGGSDHNENAVGAGLTLSAGTTTQNFDFQETAVGAAMTLSAGTVDAQVPSAVPLGVEFDGTNDWLTISAATNGASDSPNLLFSGWLNFAAMTFREIIRTTGSNSPIWFQGDQDNKASFMVKSAGGFLFRFETSALTLNDWHHILFTVDTNQSAGNKTVQLYIDDVEDTGVDIVEDAGPAFNIDFTVADYYIGANSGAGGGVAFSGCMAEIWFGAGQTLDLSVEANRRKFIDASGFPVDLGVDGEAPTSVAPLFYLSYRDGDSVTDFAIDRSANGNDFTISGTLVECASAPGLSGDRTAEVTGAAIALSAGGITQNFDFQESIAGAQFTLSAGTPATQVATDVAAIGAAIALSAGTAAQNFDFTETLVGAALALSAGTVDAQGDGEQVIGAGMTLSAGTTSITLTSSASITGMALALSAGTVGVSTDTAPQASGAQITLTAGTVTFIFDQSVDALGAEMTLSAGSIRLGPLDIQPQRDSIYSDIDPSETPFYTDIS